MLIQTFCIVQFLALAALPVLAKDKVERMSWPNMWFYSQTDCSHTPSDPEVLATANMNNCYQLVDRVAFGVGADPDRRDPPPDKQEVCLWLHKDDHCAHTDNAEVTMISVPLDDKSKCFEYAQSGEKFKSYNVAAYSCDAYKKGGYPERHPKVIDYTSPDDGN